MNRTHECPGGCGARVERHRYACRPCWYRLPAPHRDAIRRNRRHNEGHALALHAASIWFAEHPLSTSDSTQRRDHA
jgi:hypothetical protein